MLTSTRGSTLAHPATLSGFLAAMARSDRSIQMCGPDPGARSELRALASCAEAAVRGVSMVVVVAGPPGSGKSRLLDSLIDRCRADGYAVASSTVTDVDGRGLTLDGSSLNVRESGRSGVHDLPEQIATILDRAAPSPPLLVCIDDADRIDAAGARVLASLVSELDGRQILWALAGRSDVTSPAFGDLFGDLPGRDVSTVYLGALETAAVDEVIVDILHAEPSEELRQLAAQADGQPRMLIELMRAVLDEGLVSIDADRAELMTPGVPERVRGQARATLSALSPPARQAALVGSMMGDFVSYDHLATMLEVPAAALLGAIHELENAHVLVDVDGTLRFSSTMLRHAITENVPPRRPPAFATPGHRRPACGRAVSTRAGRGVCRRRNDRGPNRGRNTDRRDAQSRGVTPSDGVTDRLTRTRPEHHG